MVKQHCIDVCFTLVTLLAVEWIYTVARCMQKKSDQNHRTSFEIWSEH